MAKRLLQPQDINRFRCPGDPRLSPDGKWVVWVLQTPDVDGDRNLTDIWLGRADGSTEAHQLTASGKDRHPRWSPDGQTIAFVSDRSGRPQIWLIHPDGGEAWQLHSPQKVASPPVWSRDGRHIAFTSRVFSQSDDWEPYPGAPPNDRGRAIALARKQEAERQNGAGEGKSDTTADGDDEAKVSEVKVITRLKHRFDAVGYYGDRRSQVFLATVAGPADEAKPVRQVTFGDYDHEGPSWTPGGKLVVAAVRRPDADAVDNGQLWLVDPAEPDAPTLLYEGTGPASAPAVSPDGGSVAFLGHDNAHGRSTTAGVWVVPLLASATGLTPLGQADAINLFAPADRPAGCPISSDVRYAAPASPPRWGEESRFIYHLMGDHGHTLVVKLPVPPASTAGKGQPTTEKPAVLLGGEGGVIAGLDYASGVLAYQAETPTQPGEIFAQVIGSPPTETQLSRANDDLLAELELGEVEVISYKGADGWDIEGFLMRPPGYKGEKALPTVLFIHGGPHGVYGQSFMFQCQVVAAAGMAVVYTNPRGSRNYGQAFARAVVEDWGGKDYQDIMASLDHVIARGIADPDRLGVTGWSYGGYMTSWTITQTDRFRAAVAGAIIYNRHTFWGTSDIGYNYGTWHYGGTPWGAEGRLIERSAVRHVDRVKTPVLILHGEADLRCPVEQGEQFFQALRYLGKTAVLVRYPGEYHTLKKPSHRQDRYARMRAWFAHYLG